MPISKYQQQSVSATPPPSGVNLESLQLHHHSFKLSAVLHSSCTVSSVPRSLGIPV